MLESRTRRSVAAARVLSRFVSQITGSGLGRHARTHAPANPRMRWPCTPVLGPPKGLTERQGSAGGCLVPPAAGPAAYIPLGESDHMVVAAKAAVVPAVPVPLLTWGPGSCQACTALLLHTHPSHTCPSHTLPPHTHPLHTHPLHTLLPYFHPSLAHGEGAMQAPRASPGQRQR